MKTIPFRSFILVGCMLAANLVLRAQQIDAGIFNPSDSTLEVRVRPSSAVPTLPLSNIVFTIRWSNIYNVQLGAPVSAAYSVSKQSGEQISGAFRYQRFAAATAQSVSWAANAEIPIMTIPVRQVGQGTGTFELTNDSWTAANNSSFYVEISGQDRTGVIYQSSVGGVPLPLHVTALHACVLDERVTLRWLTDGSTDGIGFIVERQSDTPQWEVRGMTPVSAGDNDGWYVYTDDVPRTIVRGTTLRYRLRILDADGSSRYSNTIELQTEDASAADTHIDVYPSPTTGPMTASFVLPVPTQVSVSVVDLLGREVAVLEDNVTLPAGRHVRVWPVSGLASGRYLIVLRRNGRAMSVPLILTSIH